MAEHKVVGTKYTFTLDLPNYLDKRTTDLIIRVMKYCLDKESREKVFEALTNLDSQIKHLLRSLKKGGKYDRSVEKGIREFVGIHLNQGFELGLRYKPEEPEMKLVDVIAEELDYNPIVSNLPKTKQAMAEIIFYCMDLARLAYETGVMLSYYLSEELIEQHQKQLKKESWYIG